MVGILSDPGNTRTKNEDSIGFYHNKNFQLYVVADGMGGHKAGEIASKLAVETTVNYIKGIETENNLEFQLIEAIKQSNQEIFSLSSKDKSFKGMGSTITACLIVKDKMFVANVGDSRCFVLKKDGIRKVTKDHSYVQLLLDEGCITVEEAVDHPYKNIITRSLGANSSVDVDIFEVNLNEILKVILCTDGLFKELTSSEIFNITMNNTNKTACKRLLELSKLKGSKDNISVIIFDGKYKPKANYS